MWELWSMGYITKTLFGWNIAITVLIKLLADNCRFSIYTGTKSSSYEMLFICWKVFTDFTFTFHFHALEKEMATHSSILACRIPGTGEPGGLPSMGSHRVGHDWSDLAAAFTIIHSVFNEQIDKGGKNLTTGFYLVISNNHINKKVIARTNVVICVWFVYTFLM